MEKKVTLRLHRISEHERYTLENRAVDGMGAGKELVQGNKHPQEQHAEKVACLLAGRVRRRQL